MDDWNLFWGATTAAATVATAITTSAVLWLERRKRPEPAWEFVERRGERAEERGSFPGVPYMAIKLVNAGDGDAYGVRASGRGCAVRLIDGSGPAYGVLPVVRPGETLWLRMYCEQEQRKDAWIRLHWIPAPTRLRKAVTDVLPPNEGLSGDKVPIARWRYRELRWWNLLERWEQSQAIRSRQRADQDVLTARRAEDQWRRKPQEKITDPPTLG